MECDYGEPSDDTLPMYQIAITKKLEESKTKAIEIIIHDVDLD